MAGRRLDQRAEAEKPNDPSIDLTTMTQSPMLLVEEALERVLRRINPLAPKDAPLSDANGLVLAEDVRSTISIPPLPNSAMDGYAVRAGDVAGATPESPVTLPVIGEIAAGAPPEPAVQPGTAVRIMTGAPTPPGADAIVRFEDTDEETRRSDGSSLAIIGIHASLTAGTSIRAAGEDVKAGEIVLTKGTVLGPAHLGVLASLGRTRAHVYPRPVVAIMASGNELAAPGDELAAGHIYDINTYTVQGLVQQMGAIPMVLGIARDTEESVREHIAKARDADFLITSAGVSVGYYDLVKQVLTSHGDVDVWSVRMRPGKPVVFGVLRGAEDDPWGRGVPHLGLPGNPVSAMVVFHMLARPALSKMMGHTTWGEPSKHAILDEPIHNEDGRRVYARAWVYTAKDGQLHARLSGPQGSNILTAMARANGLAICPEDIRQLEAGDEVRVEMLGEVVASIDGADSTAGS